MFLYSLRRIYGHSEDDDIAICRAWSKKHAIKKFKRMYCDISAPIFPKKIENCVARVRFNHYRIAVMSEY